MPLSDRDLARIRRMLREAGVEMPCPACGSSDVTIDPTPGAMIRVERGGIDLTAPEDRQAVRAVTLICQGCGFIRLHSASVLGIK
jgi:hypothetical protein